MLPPETRATPAEAVGAAASLLVMQDITKTFPWVVANDRITFEVRAGEVHALLGENGAGKTTLMNILYGLYQPDEGAIWLRGRRIFIRSPRDAAAFGIGMVPQHALLIRRHTVAENVALGLSDEGFLFPARSIEARIRDLSSRYGLVVDPRARVTNLSPSEQQRVEIIKALIRSARILILDEPTSVLTPQEARGLFDVLRRMKREGHAVIFISHKLDEVAEIADRVTVLRRGRVASTMAAAGADKRTLARTMVGRDVEFRPVRSPNIAHGEALSLRNVVVASDRGLPALRDVTLEVGRGEILGIAGVAGNGQRELVEVAAGLRPVRSGQVRILTQDLTNRAARVYHETGVAHIPEDRMRLGIVPAMSVAENLVLKAYRDPPFARRMVIDGQAVLEHARRLIAEYEIVTPGPGAPARLLSGGNIQKVILSRELSGQPGLIVAAHPTSGLDVSTTEHIHSLLLGRRRDGAGVLLVSEDLDEILTLSDRIAVLFSGQIAGIVGSHEAHRERIGLMMMGQTA